ncbi:hypothetical protein BAE44_0009819 [Dichanthelium oligosanthes]|uniref:Uncharacterized protein n=1 Tax=Dichanthelium oligosanthes TaxID=888268 RepID=A0A1E5VVN7_9POAL|nr:hypothetical protein BAE44_0009819 [Dichanthelium oligosanthes]
MDETTVDAVEPEPAATAAASEDSEDDEEEEEDGMTSMEYIMDYKELPPFEVEMILRKHVERAPFSESEAFRALMSADPAATQDDIEDAFVEHEEQQDARIRFHEWVRSEFERPRATSPSATSYRQEGAHRGALRQAGGGGVW